MRSGVGRSSGRNAQNVKGREQKGSTFYVLSDPHKYAKDGANVLSIEAHSSSLESSEFLLNPVLVIED